MESYSNENDQVTALKDFFVNNGKAIAAGLIIGIGAIVGWNYWQSHQSNKLQDAAQSYATATANIRTTDKANIELVSQFAADNNNTYGSFAGMDLAQYAIEKNDLPSAEKALSEALTKTKNEDLKDLINSRLARIQIAQKNADGALITAELIKGTGWAAVAQDIRGDALLQKGDIAGAREAYSKGISSQGSDTVKSFMTFKLDNLSS